MNALPTADGNMAALHAAEQKALRPELFRAHFLGALAGELIGRPDIWADALETANRCDQRAAVVLDV